MSANPKGSLPNGPAYYAHPRLIVRPRMREWWTLLHPPYTLWHLAYVVIGACLVGPVNSTRLVASVLAFFLAVGLGAHALDELHGRPLMTTIPSWQLIMVAAVGILGAVVLGVIGTMQVSVWLTVFIVVGVVLAVGYNLELFHGSLHKNLVFALGWGAFPLLTSAFAQHGRLTWAAGLASVFAALLAQAQRQLSTPARALRRRTRSIEGRIEFSDGSATTISSEVLLAPLEQTLRSLSWCVVVLAGALLCSKYFV